VFRLFCAFSTFYFNLFFQDAQSDASTEISTLQIDQQKLAQIQNGLASSTSGWTVEELERAFVKLMSAVDSFKDKFDRRQLPDKLQAIVLNKSVAQTK
jgi:hypothetical protein